MFARIQVSAASDCLTLTYFGIFIFFSLDRPCLLAFISVVRFSLFHRFKSKLENMCDDGVL